jgi:pentose-5-phosphate-3-epimerase
MVEKVALEQVNLQLFQLSHVSNIPTLLRTYSTILVVDGVVKQSTMPSLIQTETNVFFPGTEAA